MRKIIIDITRHKTNIHVTCFGSVATVAEEKEHLPQTLNSIYDRRIN